MNEKKTSRHIEDTKIVYRITDLCLDDRPRERLQKQGAQALSKAELLAILIRVGLPGENAVQLSERLLGKYKGITGLHRAPFEELMNEYGLGPAKAAQIKAALELGYRMAREDVEELPSINSPADAAALVVHDLSGREQEHLRVILLDTRNRVQDIVEIYKGSVNSSQVHIGELFRSAIRRNAPAIIIVHNHPSGDPTPSPDDVAVTRAVVQAGKLLSIEVLDHLIVGSGKWVSLKERGLGFASSEG